MEDDLFGQTTKIETISGKVDTINAQKMYRTELQVDGVSIFKEMQNSVCADNRVRGMFQFYGANRTGRFAGRLVQLQNLPQNHMSDLAEARGLVRCGNYDALDMLYDDIPDTLSQLIRTAFIPPADKNFIVADFSAIEARVIAWFAGEAWRSEVFKNGGDIYCASASQMFGVPVEKHGINGHLRQKGPIYILFEKENIDTGKMEGELLLSILSSLAESESRSISENETWSIQKRFRNGTYKIAYPPYGYDYTGGEMVVNPEQSEIVKWIFAEVLSGRSTTQIAKALNARGISTKRGGRWTGHTINGMIKNEKYTGDVIFQKTYSDDTFTRRRNNGERDQFFAQGHHEAIISHEDFDAANDIIARNAAEKGIYADSRKYQNRYAFSGKVICRDCGAV